MTKCISECILKKKKIICNRMIENVFNTCLCVIRINFEICKITQTGLCKKMRKSNTLFSNI